MIDSFVIGWFCGFSTRTTMNHDVSRGIGRGKPVPFPACEGRCTGWPRQSRHPAPASELVWRCRNPLCSHQVAAARQSQGYHPSQGSWCAPHWWKLPWATSTMKLTLMKGNIPALPCWLSPRHLRPSLELAWQLKGEILQQCQGLAFVQVRDTPHSALGSCSAGVGAAVRE